MQKSVCSNGPVYDWIIASYHPQSQNDRTWKWTLTADLTGDWVRKRMELSVALALSCCVDTSDELKVKLERLRFPIA
jgi:hypothetical protein